MLTGDNVRATAALLGNLFAEHRQAIEKGETRLNLNNEELFLRAYRVSGNYWVSPDAIDAVWIFLLALGFTISCSGDRAEQWFSIEGPK